MGSAGARNVASATHPAGLIDTSILIDASRSVPQAVAFVNGQRAVGGVHVSIISAMELIQGALNASDLRRLQRMLRHVIREHVTSSVSKNAYGLMERYVLSHNLLIPGALIAATALEHGLPLYTLNLRHFQMIPGLAAVRPY